MTRTDESTIRQEQNDLAFRLRQARDLRTMHVIVPDAVPGFDFLAFFATIAVVLGAFYGGYSCWTRGLDIAQATEATAYATWTIFNIAGDFTANLAPTSQVLFVVGWVVRWIFGLYFSCCAGIGALFGAGAVWGRNKSFGCFTSCSWLKVEKLLFGAEKCRFRIYGPALGAPPNSFRTAASSSEAPFLQ